MKFWIDRGSMGLKCPYCFTKVACQERKQEPEVCPCCGWGPKYEARLEAMRLARLANLAGEN